MIDDESKSESRAELWYRRYSAKKLKNAADMIKRGTSRKEVEKSMVRLPYNTAARYAKSKLKYQSMYEDANAVKIGAHQVILDEVARTIHVFAD